MKSKKQYDAMHVYCTGGTRQKLQELAEAERRSLSAEVQQLIEEAHARRFGSKPKLKAE